MANIWSNLRRIARHRWYSVRNTIRGAIPAPLQERLEQQVANSEQRHSGQIRICVESALPVSYLWRQASARERAITLFGKLRVWDTEHNNGVLIYLLLADRAIEVVADRGVRIPGAQWEAMVKRLGGALAVGQWEQGLFQALEAVSTLMAVEWPVDPPAARTNELPDRPWVR